MKNYLQPPKKLIVINDMVGVGRCSMTVAIPVISACKVQACPVPTSVFSNHTGFPNFFKEDLTDALPSYLEGLSKVPVDFQGIYCGYLGSMKQIQLVGNYIRKSKEEYNPLVILDPIMGDHGTCYRTITPEFCNEMRSLLPYSDIITPNITEACILTETAYHPCRYSEEELLSICLKLQELGASKIVITGIKDDHNFYNFIYEHNNNYILMETPIAGESRPGTGDIFASIISALVLREYDLVDAVNRASEFIGACTSATSQLNIPVQEGVALELFLSNLIGL
ncbi:pyridoxamine kinase [Clostridium culturomicium]|uniref:pyridoxamine kinase n=1 Tax=Clostridium culturomicium TaxID=1499683 RepID=UPI00058E9F2F|nr:pyridoxamine kinase [Clostridium culturomicium]